MSCIEEKVRSHYISLYLVQCIFACCTRFIEHASVGVFVGRSHLRWKLRFAFTFAQMYPGVYGFPLPSALVFSSLAVSRIKTSVNINSIIEDEALG